MIPKPFARAVGISGEPFYVGSNDDLEVARLCLESDLNDLQAQAKRQVRGTKTIGDDTIKVLNPERK